MISTQNLFGPDRIAHGNSQANAGAAEGTGPLFRSTLVDDPPALLLRLDRVNGSEAFFASVRRAFMFDARLALRGCQLTSLPNGHLSLLFTHPNGITPLAEFANAFPAFIATLQPPFPAALSSPAFEMSTAFPSKLSRLAQLCDLMEEIGFSITECTCAFGFRFTQQDAPNGFAAHEVGEYRFKLKFAGQAPDEAVKILLAHIDPQCPMTFRRCGVSLLSGPFTPALADVIA